MAKTAHTASGLDWPLVGLAVCLFFPALSKVQRYLGLAPIPVYVATVFLALLLVARYIRPWFLRRIGERRAFWLATLTILLLVAAFVAVYPLANSGVVGGGSDRDEALNIATTELLHGRYPYYRRTVVAGLPHELGLDGNPISPLPGSLLLAVPFVLLGNGAYQSFFWVFAFFLTARWYLKDGRSALLLLWTTLVLSPIVLHEVVTGGDLLANSLWVLISVLLVVKCVPHPRSPVGVKVVTAILLGVGLSSRANFGLLLPLIFSTLVQNAGWRQAATYIALTCLAFAVVTVQFYMYDPQGFSPLHAYNKLSQFEIILPRAGLLIPLLSGAIALVLACQRLDSDALVLLRNSAIVQAFPVVCTVVLSSLGSGQPNFDDFAWYGVSFMFLGALAAWASSHRSALRQARAPS